MTIWLDLDNCDVCGGTGQMYLSDGIYTQCDQCDNHERIKRFDQAIKRRDKRRAAKEKAPEKGL